MFCDESSSNAAMGYRKYGWAPRNTIALVKRWLRKGERSSILPGYTKGYIATIVKKGSITQEIFENWLEEDLLPVVPRIEGLPIILVMDNAAIHHSERIITLCSLFNVQLEYLPPYCPWFNPIETSFHDIKSFIRRFYIESVDGTHTGWDLFLNDTIRALGTGEDAEMKALGHFRNAGCPSIYD